MNAPWLNKLSDFNPQLFRELKGNLNPRNVAIAVAISLIGQLLLLVGLASKLPHRHSTRHYYCLKDSTGVCLKAFEHVIINWQLWWLDIFVGLSAIGIFALSAIGVYLLVSDLAKEERRGTLNFIRLSPRSTQTILLGKMMGVPVLLYLVALLALPLHLWAGIAATIPVGKILIFDGVLVASCMFFYSAAQLFALATAAFLGFQAWLASGFMLMFLGITFIKLHERSAFVVNNCLDWLNLFNPWVAMPYVIQPVADRLDAVEDYFRYSEIASWQWFGLPLGTSAIAVVSLVLINYALWNYWIWHGLSRRFPNPSATIISKRQSYGLVACFQVAILGFARVENARTYHFIENFSTFLFLNLFLFLGLIAILSPSRQALHDWARYRFSVATGQTQAGQTQASKSDRAATWQDWIWGEKSPSPLAIAVNLLIAAALIVPWTLLYNVESEDKIKAIASVVLYVTLISIYALIAQLMLLMRTSKRSIWAASAVGLAIVLPILLFLVLRVNPEYFPFAWMFSIVPLLGVEYANAPTVFMAFLSHLVIIAGLSFSLKRQLAIAGRSGSKDFFARQSS